jgi:hypothetical protein
MEFLAPSMRLLRDLAIKSRAEARGNVKGFFISNELDYVPCAVKDCDAMLALLKMSFHSSAKISRYFIIDITGDVLKNVRAVDGNSAR